MSPLDFFSSSFTRRLTFLVQEEMCWQLVQQFAMISFKDNHVFNRINEASSSDQNTCKTNQPRLYDGDC